jgi:hypothetical protein
MRILLIGLLFAACFIPGVACDPTPKPEESGQEQVAPDAAADAGSLDAKGEPATGKEPAPQEPATGKEPTTGKEPVSEPPTGKEPTKPEPAPQEPSPEPVAPDAGMEMVPEKVMEKVVETTPELPTEKPVASGVPTDATKLFAWLKAGSYKNWSAESKIHASVAVHAAAARVFINSTIETSMKASNTSHPVGSALVKELYQSDYKTLRGWAVMVKTTTTNKNGSDWYWYEILSTTSGTNPVANGNGVSLCTGCHSSGKDSVRTAYPLQ